MHRKSVSAKTKKRKSIKKQKGYGADFIRSLVSPNFKSEPMKGKVLDYSRPTQNGKGCACSFTGLPQIGKGSYVSRATPTMMIPYQTGKGKSVIGMSSAILGVSQLGKGKKTKTKRKSQKGKGRGIIKRTEQRPLTKKKQEIDDSNNLNKAFKETLNPPKNFSGKIAQKLLYNDDYYVRQRSKKVLEKAMSTRSKDNKGTSNSNFLNGSSFRKFIDSDEFSRKLKNIFIPVSTFKVDAIRIFTEGPGKLENFSDGFEKFYTVLRDNLEDKDFHYADMIDDIKKEQKIPLIIEQIRKGNRADFSKCIDFENYIAKEDE